MVIVLFSVKLGWLPSDGNMTIGGDSGWALIGDRLDHLVLPTLALASFFIAVYARLMRASMLEVRARISCAPRTPRGCSPSSSRSATCCGTR